MTEKEMQAFIDHGYMVMLALMCIVAVVGAIWIRVREHSRASNHLQQFQSKVTGVEGPLTKSEAQALDLRIDRVTAKLASGSGEAEVAREREPAATT